jgi:AI-2 transport protein TqsA
MDQTRKPPASNTAFRSGKFLLLLAALVVVIAGLKVGRGFCVPVLLAFFVATVSFPITAWLRTRKVPRWLAVLLTVLFDFSFIAGVIVLAINLVGDLQRKWDERYAAQFSDKIRSGAESLAVTLDKWGIEDSHEKIRLAVENNLTNFQQIRFERIWDVGTGLLGHVVGFFGTSLAVLILTVFMLTEARMFGRRFAAISQARGPNMGRMLSATRDIQRYLAIKTAISLITGVLAGLLCWSAGLDFYVLWGILAFALNFIPVIGSLVAGVPPVILALLVAGLPTAIIVALGYLLINNFLGNFVEPLLVGRRFGISSLVVVVSVLFWGWVWGPLGMLLAVPLTMVLKVILDGSEEFRWISVAISAEQPGAVAELELLEITPAPPEAEPEQAVT